MRTTRTKLMLLAGVIAFIGLAAGASADRKETTVMYVMGGVSGANYSDCNYNPIYSYGEVYNWAGVRVCEARSYQYGVWGWSTSDCSSGSWQRLSLRTSSNVYYYGGWTSYSGGETSFASGNINARQEGGSCSSRTFLGYSFSTEQEW